MEGRGEMRCEGGMRDAFLTALVRHHHLDSAKQNSVNTQHSNSEKRTKSEPHHAKRKRKIYPPTHARFRKTAQHQRWSL
jgi:hypothetical protein